MLLINNAAPYLRIYDPVNDCYVQFEAGKLEIGPEDPSYSAVMAEGARNPSIAIIASATFCPECGEPFEGKTAKANLGTHRKLVHFDAWVADREVEYAKETTELVKERAGFPCDVCQPLQVFGDADALALHTSFVHEQSSTTDTAEAEAEAGRPGEVAPVG